MMIEPTMSSIQGNVSGTGADLVVVPSKVLNCGNISITCNSTGRIAVANNGGNNLFYVLGRDVTSLVLPVATAYSTTQTYSSTYLVVGLEGQTVKTVVGTGGEVILYDSTAGWRYTITYFYTGTNSMNVHCIAYI